MKNEYLTNVEYNEYKAKIHLFWAITVLVIAFIAFIFIYNYKVEINRHNLQIEAIKAGLIQRVVVIDQGWGAGQRTEVVWAKDTDSPDKLATLVVKK